MHQLMVSATGITKFTRIQMPIGASVATGANQRRARGLGRIVMSYTVVPYWPVGGQSQVGHVDHITALSGAQQEVFPA